MRWFLPGPTPAEVRDWFGGAAATNESRQDVYFVADGNDGVGLKLRGSALELKLRTEAIRGEGPNWSGLAECWQKWRWPYDQARLEAAFEGTDSHLIVVHKQRAQRFNEGACAMEMTELSVHQQPWWTLGFDVFDRPGDDGRAVLLSFVSSHLSQYPGPPLALALSRGYPAWLTSL